MARALPKDARQILDPTVLCIVQVAALFCCTSRPFVWAWVPGAMLRPWKVGGPNIESTMSLTCNAFRLIQPCHLMRVVVHELDCRRCPGAMSQYPHDILLAAKDRSHCSCMHECHRLGSGEDATVLTRCSAPAWLGKCQLIVGSISASCASAHVCSTRKVWLGSASAPLAEPCRATLQLRSEPQ